jgi:3-hydroxyisobutyrate dehydrogenase
MTEASEFKALGFIGLGAMGKPMLEHLARKLPKESRIWVYDVVEKAVDEVCAIFPDRVLKGTSAAHVAQHAVCATYIYSAWFRANGIGYDSDHGAGRFTRTHGVS